MDAATLGFGSTFSDLATREGLVRLYRLFVAGLAETAPEMHARLMAARAEPAALDAKAEGQLVVALGPAVQDFVGTLFGLQNEPADITMAAQFLVRH